MRKRKALKKLKKLTQRLTTLLDRARGKKVKIPVPVEMEVVVRK